jgi:preprotein translocase subunit SecA
MAGRGTDIQLGGNLEMLLIERLRDVTDDGERARITAQAKAEIEEARAKVRAAGGLFVIGTERHESRRIDNQLRGRSGRQGDPGASIFFLSLQDDLMRIFGAHNQTQQILARLGLRDGEKIAHPWITTALLKAQHKVEARNFDMRKNLLKFDNIMNDQRKVIYEQRREIMGALNISETIKDLRDEVIHTLVTRAIPPHSYHEQWDLVGLKDQVKDVLALDLLIDAWGQENGIAETEIEERIQKAVQQKLDDKAAMIDPDAMRRAEKAALLGVLDQSWKDHLLSLDQLRQGIHLRGYGQRDPLNEYSREAFGLFQLMLDRIREDVTRALMHSEIRLPSLEEIMARSRAAIQELHGASLDSAPGALFGDDLLPEGMALRKNNDGPGPRAHLRPAQNVFNQNDPATWTQTPRNSLCPCGSGRKYKHCHGQLI